jgi:hypothetical protein
LTVGYRYVENKDDHVVNKANHASGPTPAASLPTAGPPSDSQINHPLELHRSRLRAEAEEQSAARAGASPQVHRPD